MSLLKDTTGQYIAPPKTYTNMKQIISNQLKYDAQDGSDILVFDPNAMVIGTQTGIIVKVVDNTDECIKKGLVCFVIMAMTDCQVVMPKHICKVTGFGATAE